MNKLTIFSSNHSSTSRNYIERMSNNKVHCMEIAQRYDRDYWDGDRSYGYGGYRYDGRYATIAKALIERYSLDSNSRVLDFGCGKGYLLYEIKKIINCHIIGIDKSQYAIENSKEEIRSSLQIGGHELLETFNNNSIDLFISTMTLHNFGIEEFERIIETINRISKDSIITLESFRNNRELFNLQCWALTCKSFFSDQDWRYILERNKYKGDYELLYFE